LTISSSNAIPILVKAPPARQNRILAVDVMRGIAIALMALEHAGEYLNQSLIAESYMGNPVSPAHSWRGFVAGLLTNLAAPTFWLLAGCSVALFVAARLRAGESERKITKFLLIRAGLIAMLDLTVCNWIWPDRLGNVHVLLSIAVTLACLSILRRLPRRWLIGLIIVLIVGYQVLLVFTPHPLPEPHNWLEILFVMPWSTIWPTIEFPVLSWGALTLLGFLIGQRLSSSRLQQSRSCLAIGGGLLVLWLILRLIGGFGDYMPYASSQGWIYFFAMSKAPLSLTYLSFNLGWSMLVMAGLFLFANKLNILSITRWLAALGQATLFVYIAHLGVYLLLGKLFDLIKLQLPGLAITGISWLIGLVILVRLAYMYSSFKRAHPKSILKYI
jgi:uncharacterized membrane protein